MRKPNIENLYAVLAGQKPERPTLFELYFNLPLYLRLAGDDPYFRTVHPVHDCRFAITAFKNAGYDYATVFGSDFAFPKNPPEKKKSVSMFGAGIISDWESFEAYQWPDPGNADYSKLKDCLVYLPAGMKLMIMGPGGVLEVVIALCGYEATCMMLYDEPELLKCICDEIGSRIVKYYEICAGYESVGIILGNDDWGFNAQTMLPVEAMRELVFPWHKKIVEAAHAHGKPAVLHSCGNLERVYDDIIDDMGYDGKHSFEDKIQPVEDAYKQYAGRIAILGGLDIDFVARSTPGQIKARASAMLELAAGGGYALGTGNSVPEYIPQENFFALTSCALGE